MLGHLIFFRKLMCCKWDMRGEWEWPWPRLTKWKLPSEKTWLAYNAFDWPVKFCICCMDRKLIFIFVLPKSIEDLVPEEIPLGQVGLCGVSILSLLFFYKFSIYVRLKQMPFLASLWLSLETWRKSLLCWWSSTL